MTTVAVNRSGGFRRFWNRVWTYLSKPQNAILLILGIILTVTTIYPLLTIARDTVAVHPGSIDNLPDAQGSKFEAFGTTLTTYNWSNLFTESISTRIGRQRVTQSVASVYLWSPLLNSVLVSVFACFGAFFSISALSFIATTRDLILILAAPKLDTSSILRSV